MSKRIGVLGMGRMGERIALAAKGLGHEVAAVFDRDANAFAYQNSPALKDIACADIEDFWKTELDLVAIATHGPSHCPLIIEAIDRGFKRVLVEKPLGTSVAEAREAKAAADRAGARVVVNHGRRYCSVYDTFGTLDGTPEMGRLALGTLTMGAAGTGCMGTHFFDLFNRVFGDPVSVYATVTTPTIQNPRGAEFDDPGATAIIHYPNGRRALVDMGDDVGVPGRMDFIYERGRVIVENELSPWRILSRKEKDRNEPVTRYGLPLEEKELEPFRPCEIIYATSGAISDALSDEPTISGLDVGLSALEVFAAIRWSAKTGAPVSLPLSAEAESVVYPIS